jgi:hypothetical protein
VSGWVTQLNLDGKSLLLSYTPMSALGTIYRYTIWSTSRELDPSAQILIVYLVFLPDSTWS